MEENLEILFGFVWCATLFFGPFLALWAKVKKDMRLREERKQKADRIRSLYPLATGQFLSGHRFWEEEERDKAIIENEQTFIEQEPQLVLKREAEQILWRYPLSAKAEFRLKLLSGADYYRAVIECKEAWSAQEPELVRLQMLEDQAKAIRKKYPSAFGQHQSRFKGLEGEALHLAIIYFEDELRKTQHEINEKRRQLDRLNGKIGELKKLYPLAFEQHYPQWRYFRDEALLEKVIKSETELILDNWKLARAAKIEPTEEEKKKYVYTAIWEVPLRRQYVVQYCEEILGQEDCSVLIEDEYGREELSSCICRNEKLYFSNRDIDLCLRLFDIWIREQEALKLGNQEPVLRECQKERDEILRRAKDYYEAECRAREEEENRRNEAFRKKYPLGVEYAYKHYRWDIAKCIKEEWQIKLIEGRERERIAEEKKKAEAAQKKQAARSRLRNSAYNWENVKGILPVYYLYYYYPKNCNEVVMDYKKRQVQQYIWNFKDGKNWGASTDVVKVLKHFFDSEALKYATFVCIPASSVYKNRVRYESFAESVCLSTGMENAFEHVKVTEDRDAAHLGGADGNLSNVTFDSGFFYGKEVIIFDDIITRGNSMSAMKHRLESMGAHVVGAITLGKTVHHDCGEDPFDRIN